MSGSLEAVVRRSRVVVSVGQGGVGKTSTSAAVALHGAYSGRRTLVLTIDPARRLANALGLPEMGNEERVVGAAAFAEVGLPEPSGRMTAMMLDIKKTWDDVISRYHPDPERRSKLLANRLYEALSTALAGSQEYMAMEKLYELSHRKEDPLDLIVLDTPPATNAVDFLDAPSRILDALDNDATRWLLEPYTARGRITQKLFDSGSSFFIRTLSRFTGAELIEELAELLSCFQGMFDGFRERAEAVRRTLEANDTTFVVVATARPSSVGDARAFRERLITRGIKVGGIVLNRATPDPFEGVPVADEVLEEAVREVGGQPELAERLREVATAAHAAAREEQETARRLSADLEEERELRARGSPPARAPAPALPSGRPGAAEPRGTGRASERGTGEPWGAPAEAPRSASVAPDAGATKAAADAYTPVVLAPELPRDIHDLVGLEALRGHLFPPAS